MFCAQVYDVLFVREVKKRHVVHCVDCARRTAPTLEGFVVLEEYHLDDLIRIYDLFTLQPVRTFFTQIYIINTNDKIAFNQK